MNTTEELRIDRATLRGAAVLTLKGPVNVHTFERLDAAFDELFRAKQYKIVVDLAGVAYVSSAGAGVLMNALSQCKENNGNIVLVNVASSVLEVLDLLNLTNVVPVANDMAAAQKLL